MKLNEPAVPISQESRSPWALTSLLAGVHLMTSLVWVFWSFRDETVSRENGPMENFQAVCLFLGLCVMAVSAVRSSDPALRIFKAGLALFFGTFLLLEVDLRDVEWSWWVRLTNGRIRDAWLGLLWGFALWRFIRSREAVLQVFRDWIWTYSGLLLCVSGSFWLMSAVIDKSILVKKDLFKEEILEVNAALLMLVAAALVSRITPGTAPKP